TLNQHLNIYKNGLLNKFRRQKKEKDDKNKIDLIRKYLLKNRTKNPSTMERLSQKRKREKYT
ncbi:MAG: hypothetical protein Q8N42_02340, partial [bacterium]|nr:hypothetical protein [bacterium]